MAVVTAFDVELATTEFSNAILLLLQQSDSRLRASVDTGFHIGKTASPVQYIAPMVFRQAGARGSTITPQYAQYQRRWVNPGDHVLPVLVDTFDLLRSTADPKSAITTTMAAAANRLFDDVIIGAFFGASTTGADSSALTTETFNSGSNFPISVAIADTFGAGTEVGMTVKKIIEGKRILSKYENNLDQMEVHLGMTSQAEADLMGQIEVTNLDYTMRPKYDERGRITSFLGCTFHYSERWPYAAADSDERYLPMWVQDGMHLGLWMDVNTTISQRTDLEGLPWQAYSMLTLGATRLQAGKVIRISCLDSTGGSVTV